MKIRLLSLFLTLMLVLSIFPANSIVSAAGYDCFNLSEKVSCTEKIKVSFTMPDNVSDVWGLDFFLNSPSGYVFDSVNCLLKDSRWSFSFNASTGRCVIYPRNDTSLSLDALETPIDGKYEVFEFLLKTKRNVDVLSTHNFTFKIVEILTVDNVKHGCDTSFTRKVEIGHKEVIDPAVDPTCTQIGFTEGKHCSACDAIMVAQSVINATGHKNKELKGYPADCENDGLTDGLKCSVCNEILTPQETIPSPGHTEIIDKGTEPTCTKSGISDGKHCSVCKKTLVAQEVLPEKGHTYNKIVTEPTCTKDGFTTYTCEVCKHSYVGDRIAAPDHTYVDIPAVAPTCISVGYTKGLKCSTCDEIFIKPEEQKTTDHSYVDIPAVSPTCTSDGCTKGLKCSICNEVFVDVTKADALGHKEVPLAAVAATYEKTGLTAGKQCSVCKKITLAQNVVPVLAKTSVKSAKFTVKAKTYTGKAIKQTFKVKLDSKTLTAGIDYTVSYKNNKKIGKATVTITGIGAYKDSVKKTFKINPKKLSGLKVKAGKKQMTVSWKKNKSASGYEIVYATSKNFKKGKKTIKVTKAKTVKKVIKKLKAKKTYYVKVRAYKTVKKSKYYSSYTSAKKVKVK